MPNVITLTTTTATAGTYFEITIPNGLGGYVSRKITFEQLRDAIAVQDSKINEHYENEAAIIAQYPVGEPGWAVINDDTETIWVWSDADQEWKDTGTTGTVLSINGLTGAVTLTATDISFSSAEGLSSSEVGSALDELKLRIDSAYAGSAGGMYINQVRSNYITSTVSRENETFLFKNTSDALNPLNDANYSLEIIDENGIGYEKTGIQTKDGFTIKPYGPGIFKYVATAYSTSDGDLGGGTVTSVAITGSDSIISVSGSPITTGGTIDLTIDTAALKTALGIGYYNFTFVSGDLIGGILTKTHGLGEQYPGSVSIYDNNNKKINETNYEFTGTSTTQCQIEFFLPITGTWTGRIRI